MSRKAASRATSTKAQSPCISLLLSSSHSRVCVAAGGFLLLLLMLCHLTFLQRIADIGTLSCQQQQLPVDHEALATLQHLKYQRLTLQSVLATRLSSAHNQPHATAIEPGGAANHTNAAHVLTVPLTLFLGILSHNSASRQLARDGWLSKATSFPNWKAKFITHQLSSVTALGVQEEQRQHDDLLLTEDKSLLHQTVFMMQYALVHYNVHFIMKTEDTSYVHVGNLLQVLQASCTDATCQNESLYLGHDIRNSTLLASPGEQMSRASQEYWKHTRLKTYMPYMSGVGYVVSADLAHAVIDSAHQARSEDLLFQSGSDDVLIGFWLMSLNVRRLNHRGIIINKTSTADQQVKNGAGIRKRHTVPSPSSGLIQHTFTDQNQCSQLRLSGDVCSKDLLLFSPVYTSRDITCLQDMLLQCERMEKLQSAALDIAIRRTRASKPLLPHGKVRRVSHGSQPDQFLLGSYSTSPWSNSGSAMLALKPKAQDNKLSIGLLKASNTTGDDSWYWEHLDTSWAWNSHQGPQLQWLGTTDRYIVFNDGRCQGMRLGGDPFCSVVFDIQRLTRARVLPLPVCAVSPDGLLGLHVSFGRQEHANPGYTGQAGQSLEASAPRTDGLWLMDMISGKTRLLASLWSLLPQGVGLDPLDNTTLTDMPDGPVKTGMCFTWLSHPRFNRDASSIAVLFHTDNCIPDSSTNPTPDHLGSSESTGGSAANNQQSKTNTASLVTMDTSGANVWMLPLTDVQHFDYGRKGKLLVSTQHGLYEADSRRRTVDKLKKPTSGNWPLLSHCSYHQHSERFVLAVTAGPPQREMLVWDRWSGHIHTVGLYSPRKDRMAFLHDDMHPAWSPDGCTLAFDSTHTGQGWQVFMAGVTDLGVDMVISMPHTLQARSVPTTQQSQ
ncbi:hypothetical protein ABBQ38_015186 [Trebouxia sp. C0009 RCD-2024]